MDKTNALNINGNSLKVKKLISGNGAFLAMVALIVVGCIAFPSFSSMTNIMNLLRQTSYMAIMAVGMTFVILAGGIDLSVGSTFGLAGVLAGIIGANVTDNPAVMILLPLLVSLGIGFINGIVVAKMKITPFIATLAVMMGVRGAGLVITGGGQSVGILNDAFAILGKGKIGVVPLPVIILAAVIAVMMYVAKYTKYGRNCYAVGGDTEAAMMKGINIDRTKILTYTINGLLAGLAGLILAARSNSGQIMVGVGYEMDVIAAVVLGGTLLTGGSGKVIHSLFGMLIINLIGNLINLQGDISWIWQNVVTGALLLIILVVQSRKSDALI